MNERDAIECVCVLKKRRLLLSKMALPSERTCYPYMLNFCIRINSSKINERKTTFFRIPSKKQSLIV